MECFEFGYVIKGDVNDTLKKTVEYCSDGIKQKAKVLAGYIQSDDFLEFCKKDEKFDSTKSILENKQNTIRRILKEYYELKHQDVTTAAAKRQADLLMGFSSVKARNIAINDTATIISLLYEQERKASKYNNVKLNRVKIIQKTIDALEKDYINNVALKVYNQNKEIDDNTIKEFKKAYNNAIRLNKKIIELKQLIKNDNDIDNNKKKLDEIYKEYTEARRQQYNKAYNLVNKFGDIAQKNRNNYIEQVKRNPNFWFTKAFESSKLVNIVGEFENVLESDKLTNENFTDDEDYTNPGAESVDETTKSWEDKLWVSFEKPVAADLKLYFNTIYKLDSPAEVGTRVYNYDTNNEIGLRTTMGANFIIRELYTRGNFNSVNDFIDSVVRMATYIAEDYGLIKIADDCISDPVFANRIFCQLSNPKIIKTMSIITESGITFEQSNKSLDAMSYMIYNMLNTTRSTMRDLYTENDVNRVKELVARLDKVSDRIVAVRLKDDGVTPKELNKQIEEAIYEILKKYYPKVTRNEILGFIYNGNNPVRSNMIGLLNNIADLLQKVETTVIEYNESYNKYNNERKAYNEAVRYSEEIGQKYTKEAPLFDSSNINYDRLNEPIVNICQKLVNYSAVRNELNSVNAEGNLSSDVINNSYITNLIKQINYANKKDAQAGLRNLLEEINKGEQYKYNSFFWGIKGANGKYIQEGLFMRDDRGNVSINPNAQKLIQISLFNGVKDMQSDKSALYAKMSKGDYFATSMIAYFNPIIAGQNIGSSKAALNASQAGYFFRTPSDAPKNFIIQAPKLDAKNTITALATNVAKYADKRHNEIDSIGNKKYTSTNLNVTTISNKTADFGVTILQNITTNYNKWLNDNPNGIIAYRINPNTFNTAKSVNQGIIGNPFDFRKYGEAKSLQMFYNWLITGNNYGEKLANEEFRQAIRNKIINTKTANIAYYKEKNQPSHATVIGYLINNKHLLNNNIENIQEDDFDKYLEAKDKAAANKNNIWSAKDIYSAIKGELSTLNFNRYYYIENEDGTISIPIVYKTKDSPDIVWIKGDKIEGEINNILYNIEVEGISSVNDNKLSDDFYVDIADILKQEGIENGSIDVRINRAAPIFAGFRQNVLGELNMFINQLNNLFDNDGKGNWVLRKDTNGLIERVHFNKITYDDKGRKCILVEGKWLDKEKTEANPKAGKLSGNFFSFQKLFNTEDYKAGEELERALLLYGGTSVGEAGGLVQVKGNTATLNINSSLIRIENGKIIFNETQEVRSIIDNIIEQWIKSFNKEIVAHGKQYQNLLQELQKSNEDLVDFALNTANAYMQLDDILEGDVKFYKDAKDFLKRAKEVQAGGTAYAGFDINDILSAKIKETVGYNGAKQEIKFGNTTIDKYANAYSPVEGYAIVHAAGKYARNGFRAVTINNTVRPSKQANNIQQELFNYLKDELGEVAATKKAVEIANGYREASKTNDAQSFITIEEFMRRRYADGTFKEYEDIFQQLYELRTGQRRIEDIDISKINARIQVQKNFYYDHKYDSYTGVHYPRQIKNAEFVLIPELLEGTQLKELYNFMHKYDIGQVNTNETSKAAKKNVLTFWDNDGNINSNFEQDLISNNENAIEDYYYRFLYKQQDVPEHMKDAQNKAGVQITKKICDNANESVKPYIDTFFKNYCANIREDFRKLLFNMDWKEDKNGRLVNINSDKQTLDFTDFYKKARIEAQRLGMDSNFIEYLTPDEFGNPAMPNYMNNVSSKLESIAQAIFNSSITRQKFPGWHAAQVTQVGHGMKVLDNNGKLRELKYHPTIYKVKENPYKKVSVNITYTPDNADANGMGAVFMGLDENGNTIGEFYIDAYYDFKNKDIKSWRTDIDKNKVSFSSIGQGIEIDKEQRNKGYGKAFYYEIAVELAKKGKTLVSAKDDSRTEATNRVWKSLVKDGYAKKVGNRYEFINENIINIQQEAYAEIMIPRWSNLIPNTPEALEMIQKEGLDIQLAYRIPTEGKQSVSIVKVVGFLDDVYGSTIMLPDEWVTQTGSDFDVDSVYGICHSLKVVKDKNGNIKRIKKYSADDFKTDYAKYKYYIEDNINNKISSDIEDEFHEDKYKVLQKRLRDVVKKLRTEKDNRNNLYKELTNIGKEAGLLTFNEFSKLDEVDKLPRVVRNNNILDSMIAIMADNNSREENYSRSNFDKLSHAMKEMDTARGADSLSRSVYNPFDQMDFMENAMGGASLKAFSVTRDTFNSVNNYAKGYLGKGHEIIAEYDLIEKDANGEFIYDAEMMIKAYGLYNETTKKGDVILLDKDGKKTNEVSKAVTARVKHYRLANSYNSRNVVGELITVYSSQTTAHILDAIKEGSIFNENEFTFGTFKTLIDTGMDYRTAIAFLMQPAITTINEVNNESNSLYLTGGGNTVQKAIKRIAANAGFKLGATDITDYSNYESVLLALNSNEQFRNAYKELFGAEISTQKPIQEQQFTLNAKVLKSRLESSKITNISELSQKNNDIKNAVFDIAVCLAFDKINKTTKNLEKVLRCCNPDNFGAKQTIRETRTIVDNVIAYGFTDNEVGNTVMCGGKRLIEKLYLGFIKIEKNEVSDLDELVRGDIDVENSVYPFLAAFFKYATLTSVDVNKQLFPTENDVYNNILNAVQIKLGVIFTPKQYREYKQYMMSMIYSQIPIINTPLTVTEEGWLNDNNEAIVKSTENDTNYWNAEISRIFGFETTQKINFDIKDVFNPTKEELDKFNALTPAQKVSWIQTHIDGDLGIFNYLNVNLNNQFELKRKGFTHQSIKFTDSAENMDDIYIEFGTSFFNKSPIFRLAITDLIKYAFVVDGFKFKRGAVDKVITNNSLYKNIEDMGTGIVPAIREIFGYYANPAAGVTDEFIDKFIRSHKEYCKSIKLGKPENNKGISNAAFQFNICNRGNGLIFIPFDGRFKTLLNEINVEDAKSLQDYIVVNRSAGGNKISTLYKIDKHESGIYLIPMNLLEPNETGDYSVNPNNNKYGDISFYNTVIAEAENIGAKEYFIDKDNKVKLKNKYKEYIIPRYKFNLENNAIDNINEFQNVSVNGTEIQKAELNKLFKDVEAYVQSPVDGKGDYGVIRSDSFYISEQVGKTDIITQSIPTEAGNILVTIKRYSPSPAFKSNLHKDLVNNVSSNNTENIQKVRIEERDAYRSALASKTEAHKYYRIEHITEESVREEFEKQQQENRDNFNDEAYAITTDITNDYIDNANRITEVDETSVAMIAALRRAERRGDDIAAKALRKLDIKGINSYRSKDIKDNRRNIYHILSDYISTYADMIDKQMKCYVIGDKEYNIGESDLYEVLRSNPDEVPNIVKLLLEAITFGDTFGNIMSLPIDGMDEDTKRYIQKIRDSINKIRNSSIIKQGFDNMFNKYIANEFANNPNIRMNVVNLKDTFGDSGWWETNIGDIAMLSNKQVQVIVKIVNRIMNQAAMQDAPRKKNEFLKRFDNILAKSGSFRWENVINSNGQLIRPYTAKFLTDRDKLVDAVKDALDRYGIDSKEYIAAKLKRDEWYADNVEQPVVREYYVKKNALVREIFEAAPEEYRQYMEYIHEKFIDDQPDIALTAQERNRRREIDKKINQLTSEYKDTETLKSPEERERAIKLRNFIKAKSALDKEYFDYNDTNEFKENLKKNLAIIKHYEKNNPTQTLDKRLENIEYRSAYEWIKNNSYYILNKEAKDKINEAFSILKDEDNLKSAKIKKIIDDANAYDEFGNVDARKLSDKDIATIKELTKHKYDFSYDSNAGEVILIKDIPNNLPIFDDSFYRMLRDPSENEKEVNPRRIKIIGRINELLGKIITAVEFGGDGRIHAKDIFTKLTEEEREELANLYTALRNIKGKRKPKEIRQKFKQEVEFKINNIAFNSELTWALSNLKGTKDFDIFISIFCQLDNSGEIILDDNGNYTPNNDIYGYIEPKNDKYINKKKTAARELIENNVDFIPNEYYYAAMNEASNNGNFKEWFDANHVYNPYKHKFEPLRVWTDMKVNPEGSLKGTYSYVPTNENAEKQVKDEYANKKYKKYSNNYNSDNGHYNNYVTLSSKEKEMQSLLQETMDFFAEHNKYNTFVDQGYIPRRRKVVTDTKWAVNQLLGVTGLEFRNDSEDRWNAKVDYANDYEVENNMLKLLKGKGYQELEEIRPKGIGETDESYRKYLQDTKKKNEEIKKRNLEIDKQLFDKDYRSVFAEAISNQVVINARNKAKNWLYLLQEDLKNTEAVKISKFTGRPVINKRTSVDVQDNYHTISQDNTLKQVYGFTRRLIFEQFKEKSKLNKYADLARNITSAKYMIFNITGGIANIGTGFANIMGEAFAGDNLSKNDIREAIGMYMNNSLRMIADMYKDKSDNFAVALTKYFKVVDFDAMTERVRGETAGEYARRMRNLMYSLQSGGEHFMQNTILFAVLKSNKLFDDIDGVKRCGSFSEYIWKLEYDTMVSIISKDKDLLEELKEFKRIIRQDKTEQFKYDTFKHNIVEDFLRAHASKEIIQEYIHAKNQAIKTAKEEWKTKPAIIDLLKLKNGEIVPKAGAEITSDMINDIKNKTVNLNKKIHGVYDKLGAAAIEFTWWGSLVMQYHKHLYPGVMKRFRRRGYYNEQTNTIEVGSYVAFVDFLGKEFRNVVSDAKKQGDGYVGIAIASVQNTFKAVINTITNIKTNWNLMSPWERNAVKRCLGDLYGILSALLLGITIYAMTDDDDEKESNVIAAGLYLADRLLSESQMYTPWGLYSEGKTLWSSPIAAYNGPSDLIKIMDYSARWLFDEDFDPVYSTGIYKGKNKIGVLIKRNIPIYRVIERLNNMTKNNSYYRINEKALNMKISKYIADQINPD